MNDPGGGGELEPMARSSSPIPVLCGAAVSPLRPGLVPSGGSRPAEAVQSLPDIGVMNDVHIYIYVRMYVYRRIIVTATLCFFVLCK